MPSDSYALVDQEQAKKATYFVDCCQHPHLEHVDLPPARKTPETEVWLLEYPYLITCQNCGRAVAVCPDCHRGYGLVASLANWQNHYSQFIHYDRSTTIRRAMRLLGNAFTLPPIETGHRFYTLWQGTCDRHAHAYIWLQERPAKNYNRQS